MLPELKVKMYDMGGSYGTHVETNLHIFPEETVVAIIAIVIHSLGYDISEFISHMNPDPTADLFENAIKVDLSELYNQISDIEDGEEGNE